MISTLRLSKMFVAVLCALFAQVTLVAQTVEVKSWKEYETMKQRGFVPAWNEGARLKMEASRAAEKPVRSLDVIGNLKDVGTSCNCLQAIDDTFQVVPFTAGVAPEYRNDDGSSPMISFPFDFCYYGTTYNSCYINNNGNISFGAPSTSFSAQSFPNDANNMIAPFWTDIDTRGAGSGVVHYKVNEHALIVIWDHVGYYSQGVDKLNTFQIVITDGTSSLLPAGETVGFCYGDVQFAVGGTFGGTSNATVGCNRGDGVNFTGIGRFNQNNSNYEGPITNGSGINYLDYHHFPMNVCGDNLSSNFPPIHPLSINCDTLFYCVGDTIELSFIESQPGQSVTASLDIPVEFDNGWFFEQGNGFGTLYAFIPDTNVDIQFPITVNASDNGIPQANLSYSYIVVVNADVVPPTITGPTQICLTGSEGTLSIPTSYTNVIWSTGWSGNTTTITAPGDYSATAYFGGCETAASINVGFYPLPVPSITGESAICANATTTLSVTQPYPGYLWDDNSTGATMEAGVGNHWVVVTDNNGCNGTANFVITSISDNGGGIIIGPIYPAVETTYNYYFTVTDAVTYVWTITGGTIVSGQGTNAVDVIWNNVGDGDLQVVYTNSDGCESSPLILDVDSYVGLVENNAVVTGLYPNPATDVLFIDVERAFVGSFFTLTNSIGEMIQKGQLNDQHNTLSIAHLPQGVYFIQVNGGETHKVVKRH